jgi:putative transposase
MNPQSAHYGSAEVLQAQRTKTLQLAYAAQPLRFKGRMPHPRALPTAAWIIPPKEAISARSTDSRTVISVNRVSQSD